jgi:hypothetical protein
MPLMSNHRSDNKSKERSYTEALLKSTIPHFLLFVTPLFLCVRAITPWYPTKPLIGLFYPPESLIHVPLQLV